MFKLPLLWRKVLRVSVIHRNVESHIVLRMLTKPVSFFLTPVAKPDIASKNSPAARETIRIIKKKNICQTDDRTPETKNIFLILFFIHGGSLLSKVFLKSQNEI